MLLPKTPTDESTRLGMLQQYRVLDTPAEAAYDELVRLASLVCATPIALLSLVDAERQWFKARVGLAATETPRDISFCGHAILTDGVFVVADAAMDPRFADNPLVTGEPHIGFYAGAPVVAPDGSRLGTVCVIDRVPRRLTEPQLLALRSLAGQVATQFELRRTGRELLQANVALADAQRRLDLVVDATCDGVWQWQAEDDCVELSLRARQLLGHPVDATRFAVRAVWAGVHPADRRPLLRHLARCRKDLGTFELELRLQSAGGLERWFRLRGRMLRPTAAGGLHCVGALADVHDRRSADEALDRLSALLAESQAQAHVGGWELDLQTGALSWTEETYRIHELSPYAQLPTVERAIEFYAESSRPVVRAAVAAAIATGTPFAHELELVTAKGRRLWVMATGRAVREHGAVVRLVGAFQDITAQQAADAELRAAKAAAEASSRAKSAFLAAMSHEIRTPMHGVLGYAELLRDSVLTDEQRDHVEIIARSGTALLRLIDDILDSSKVEAGKLVLERTPVDLRSVAGDVMRLLQAHAVEQGLRLSLHAEADGSTWVLADAARIRQVMLNLVGNAVKFTAQGEVRIGIVRQGAQVRCEVVDTGIGIAPADQARLFGEFEQVEDANCRRLGGTGLGLAISRRLIEAMGGRIGMCSEPGLGSTFWFALPATAATAKSAGAVPPGPAPGLVQRARVLVAEDNVVNQRLVRAMLSRLGIEVDLAADGAEAIALATSRPYDLVLMDCLMPGTDGLAATRAIRGQERVHGGQVPIVALTANALAEDRAACLAAGMDDFVSKPFTKPVLLASLHKWLPVGRARACATPSPRAGA